MPDFSPDFERLFQEMPVPRMIVTHGPGNTYIIRAANTPILSFFGKDKNQTLGNRLNALMNVENAGQFEQSFEVSRSRKMPVTILALPGIPKQDRVYGFWINAVFDGDDFQYFDVIGQPDVKDDSALQRERDDAMSLLTSVFDVSEVGIMVTDKNRHIIRVNESFMRMYGWSRDELIGSDFSSVVTPDEREQAKSNHDEFIRSGTRSTGEMKIIRKDGSIANALFTTAMLELSQKRRFRVTTVMDITLRKQMELSLRYAKEQADAANHAKSAFLANMSHELRTPLNAIIGFSEMMANETFGPLGHDKYAEYMGDIHGSARHLLEIINEVLDMSKIEAGRIELDEKEFDLGQLIQSSVRMMASRIFDQNLKTEIDVAPDLPLIYADPRLMRQVIINILNNAIKFSNANGVIFLKAFLVDDGSLRLVIADQGIGIPEHKIAQALEPFGQVSNDADTAQQQGTGLGLPLAKAMVELHEGTLILESRLGQGTTVQIKLPSYRVANALPKHATVAPNT